MTTASTGSTGTRRPGRRPVIAAAVSALALGAVGFGGVPGIGGDECDLAVLHRPTWRRS